jgi:probable rRNA maturation factor
MKRKLSALPQIKVRNLQRKIRVDVADLQRFGQQALKLCLHLPHSAKSELKQLPEVSVLIVSNDRIAALHRQFMHEPGPTDVITFHHGEIFISAETARSNAGLFGTKLARELRLYIVHGLLHLHGFDDRNPAGARKMKTVQGKILARASCLK